MYTSCTGTQGPHEPVLQRVLSSPGQTPLTVTADCILARATAWCNSKRGQPTGNLKSSYLGRPARASASVSPNIIPPGTVTADCIMACLPDGPVRWPRPGTVHHWQQARAAQLEVVLTRTAQSDPGQARDSGLYNMNGPPARWPCPVAAARYCATGARAAQLEVFLTGTSRTRQCFSESDPARDRHGDS